MRRYQLTAAIVAGLMALVVAGGCTRVPAPGGATGTKSEKARKQAEELALNVVNGAALAQARAIPGLAQNGQAGKLRITTSTGGSHITVITPESAPPKASVPASSAPVAPSRPSVTAPSPPAPPPQMSAVKDPIAPKSSPRPGSPAIIKERVVSSIPYANEGEAVDDALSIAQDVIGKRLAELDPPVKYRPSLNEVKNEFARKDSRVIRPPSTAEREEYIKNGVNGNLVYAEYDIEVTADQIRELRTRDRITITLRIFSGLMFIAIAGFLFLRADEWTKGYLTRWLACIAVVLVGGAAAALYFV